RRATPRLPLRRRRSRATPARTRSSARSARRSSRRSPARAGALTGAPASPAAGGPRRPRRRFRPSGAHDLHEAGAGGLELELAAELARDLGGVVALTALRELLEPPAGRRVPPEVFVEALAQAIEQHRL